MPHRSAGRPVVGDPPGSVGCPARPIGRGPVLAVLSLVGLLTFVALAFVARPAPTPGLDGDAPTHVGQVTGGHPDFVGVAESRPSVGSAHLLALTPAPASLAVALLATASALVAGRSAAQQARWRRWRARLEGAPPLVA